MAIFITGDTHRDFTRFKKGLYPPLDALTKADYVIICGDFGGVWNGGREDQYWLDWLEAKPFTTLFVDGNHENFDLLNAMPVEDWNGGKIHRVRPSILHLMRGQIFTLGGKTFFTLGGASTHDVPDGILEPDDPLFHVKRRWLNRRQAHYRVNHQSWWSEELPSPEELESAQDALRRAGWQVDYIVTHCCPAPIHERLTNGCFPQDSLTYFFDDLWRQCQFQNWFFGHYHANHMIANRFVLLYEQIIQIL